MAFCYIRNKPIPVMAPDEAAEQLAPLIETLRADALPEHGHLTGHPWGVPSASNGATSASSAEAPGDDHSAPPGADEVIDVRGETVARFRRGMLTAGGRLDLCKCKLGPTGAELVCEALADNTSVKALLMGQDGLGPRGAEAVAGLLQSNQTVETVFLGCNDIGVEGVSALAEVLKSNDKVHSLWLKRNHFGAVGAQALADTLSTNTVIEVLDLVSEDMGDEGSRVICDAIAANPDSKVSTLFLNENGLGPETGPACAAMLTAGLGRPHQITSLYLGFNLLGDTGVAALAPALALNTATGELPSLTLLNLASNDISNEGVAVLAEALATNSVLLNLHLGYGKGTGARGGTPNRITSDGAETLAALLLGPDCALVDLNLSGNKIGTVGANALIQAVEVGGRLHVLNLGGNKAVEESQLRQAKTATRNNRKNDPSAAEPEPVVKYKAHAIDIASVYRTGDPSKLGADGDHTGRAAAAAAVALQRQSRKDLKKVRRENRRAGLAAPRACRISALDVRGFLAKRRSKGAAVSAVAGAAATTSAPAPSAPGSSGDGGGSADDAEANEEIRRLRARVGMLQNAISAQNATVATLRRRVREFDLDPLQEVRVATKVLSDLGRYESMLPAGEIDALKTAGSRALRGEIISRETERAARFAERKRKQEYDAALLRSAGMRKERTRRRVLASVVPAYKLLENGPLAIESAEAAAAVASDSVVAPRAFSDEGHVEDVADDLADDGLTSGSDSLAGAGPVPAVPVKGVVNVALKCNVCKTRYRAVHWFYEQLCIPCGEFNYAKREAAVDLTGRVAVVTGGRIKIGFEAAVKLLRCGATVVVTTRFPTGAAVTYGKEADFDDWSDRLHIYGPLDLRDLPSVEIFTAWVADNFEALDIVINNAAQTIWRPPVYYAPLRRLEANLTVPPAIEARIHRQAPASSAHPLSIGGPTSTAAAATASTATADGARSGGGDGNDDEVEDIVLERGSASDSRLFPADRFEDYGVPVDLRPSNTWSSKLEDVPTVELAEVHAVNALAPFIINRNLTPLLRRSTFADRYVVNVSAMEGKFTYGAGKKRPFHPHTNMAKAALNMLTKTTAADLAEENIFVNAVDTGWVTDERPVQAQHATHGGKLRFEPPLDSVDGAARVLDPIFTSVAEGRAVYGQFLKDFHAIAW